MSKRRDDDADDLEDSEPVRKKAATRQHFQAVKSAADCVARFNDVCGWHLHGKKFNADTFKRLELEHRRRHGMTDMKPTGQTFDGSDRAGTRMEVLSPSAKNVNNTFLLPGDYSFFLDPDKPPENIFAVFTEEDKEDAIRQGFIEVKCAWVSGKRQFPPRKDGKSPMLEPIDRPAPTDLLLPRKDIPNLFRNEKESCAVALVRAFEDKFVHCKTFEPYSPCGLWTEKARKEAGLTSSKFTTWCAAYYAVREIKKGEKPEAIGETMTDLRKLGVHNKPTKGSWFEVVSKLANRKVN
jgi:hypothetical protein